MTVNFWMSIVIGFVFSLAGGGVATWWLVRILRRGTSQELRPVDPPHAPITTGLLERSLYTGAAYAGINGLIIAWLAIKTAGSAGRWIFVRHNPLPETSVPQKMEFTYHNIFLAGNAVSLLYGLLGAKIIVWLQSAHVSKSLAASSGLILVTALTTLVAKREVKRPKASAAGHAPESHVSPLRAVALLFLSPTRFAVLVSEHAKRRDAERQVQKEEGEGAYSYLYRSARIVRHGFIQSLGLVLIVIHQDHDPTWDASVSGSWPHRFSGS